VNRPLKQTPGFARTLRRLLKRKPEILHSVQETLRLLANDAFDPRLRTHKLKGELAGSLSCSVDYDLRMVFELADDAGIETVYLLSIGTHDEVY
jgi:addiction module RelE/StbE family toxin